MGQPKVQGSDTGFFTRLGRAIDTFNGDASYKTAPAKADVADVKPLPQKYATTGGRVVRGPLANYVTNALKLADDMRALAVKEEGIFNRTSPKDVDKVLTKYKPLIVASNTSTQKADIAKSMLKELFGTPTGENLFWDLRAGHEDFYNCSTSVENLAKFIDTSILVMANRTTCTVGGVVTKSIDVRELHEEKDCHGHSCGE